MSEEKNKLEELSDKLDELLAMHNDVSVEIDSLRVEILRLKVEGRKRERMGEIGKIGEIEEIGKIGKIGEIEEIEEIGKIEEIEEIGKIEEIEEIGEVEGDYFASRGRKAEPFEASERESILPKEKSFDIEKLIGENLINKIGILVLVIGVAIGGKYSIENNLISPLARIVLGYAVGIVLLLLSIKLKEKYLNFSAVLVSGGMSILYFITYFSYNFYHLIGQEIAFGLMVIFTIFTVLSALNYDKQVIAHLGLVGAVSVPFLLSNDTGNAAFLFSYLTLINLGIAFISLRKNWKLLFYSAFVLTWIVYATWLIFGYSSNENFVLAFGFLTVFFLLFYVIFIAYKLLNLKKYTIGDIGILLVNSFIYFGLGYGLLYNHKNGEELLGLFALANATIHFIAAFIIHKRKLADKNIFYLIVGLVVVCLTLAIPIQLSGHWITMMWAAEAALLFYIGRSKSVGFYEYLSFGLMLIAMMSLMSDWSLGYASISQYSLFNTANESDLNFLMNPLFLNSMISCLCFGLITWMNNKSDWKSIAKIDKPIHEILDYVLPTIFVILLFFSFRYEISNYFAQLYADSNRSPNASNSIFDSNLFNINIRHTANVNLINYSIIFFSVLTIFILKKVNNEKVHWAMIIVNILVIASFLVQGLYELSELRENYISQENAQFYTIDKTFLGLRYLSFLFLAFLMALTYQLIKKYNKDYIIKVISEILMYVAIFWILTSELIQWLDFTERSETHGLALSIFWGICSVAIISIGIWKKKKHLRIMGMAIFALTLIKLFFYDLAHLNTISKTIVMISLGALLLLTSFLYNKYTIEDEEKL